MPNRTWTFFGEIVNDSLAQMPVLGHRVDVRDVTGSVHRCVLHGSVGVAARMTLRTSTWERSAACPGIR